MSFGSWRLNISACWRSARRAGWRNWGASGITWDVHSLKQDEANSQEGLLCLTDG
jgi:hypothetical protein